MPKLGKDCKLYYSDDLLSAENPPASASWKIINNVRDSTLGLEKGEADVSTRGSGGWRQTLGTLKEGSIDFEMVWETEDAAFSALQNAFMNNAELALAVMDGEIDGPGSEGLASNFSVMSFTRSEPLEEGVTVAVTIKPSSETDWYVVA